MVSGTIGSVFVASSAGSAGTKMTSLGSIAGGSTAGKGAAMRADGRVTAGTCACPVNSAPAHIQDTASVIPDIAPSTMSAAAAVARTRAD